MHRNVNKFLILTSGRSGSNTLRNYLNSVEGVRCHGEVFIRKHYYDYDGIRHYCIVTRDVGWYYRYLLNPRLTRHTFSSVLSYSLIDSFLESLFYDTAFSAPWSRKGERRKHIANPAFEEERLVGFKVAYGSYNGWSGLRKWIAMHSECKIVHLIRDNSLKKIISWEVAKQHHLYHIEKNEGKGQATVKLDVSTILSKLQRTEAELLHFRKQLDRLENKVQEFHYETLLLKEVPGEIEKLSCFLGLEPNVLSGKQAHYSKVNSNRIDHVVTNFSQLKNTLKGTKFERFVYE